MNKVVLAGNLTKDPKSFKDKKGKDFAVFTLACKDADYIKSTEPDYVNCFVFGKTSKAVLEWCKKGQCVAVDGAVKFQTNKTKDGNYFTSCFCLVRRIEFLTGSKKGSPEKIEDVNSSLGDIPQDVLTGFTDVK